jgi:hypothetical protein
MEPPKYLWQQAVVDAFMEFRPAHLPEKIEIAQSMLAERLRNPQQLDLNELSALRDALHALRVFLPLPVTERRAKATGEGANPLTKG